MAILPWEYVKNKSKKQKERVPKQQKKGGWSARTDKMPSEKSKKELMGEVLQVAKFLVTFQVHYSFITKSFIILWDHGIGRRKKHQTKPKT